MIFSKGRARQIFILCCFALWLIVSACVTATSIRTSLLLGTIAGLSMVAEATCVLFYGIAFRPERWRWIARVVPLLFVLVYAWDWAYAGGLPEEEPFDSAALAASAMGFVTYWVLLYLLFRYGYSPKLPPDGFSIWVMLVALLCAGFISFIQHVPVFAPRIRVVRNYLPELNELTRPALYNARENAALDYMRLAIRIPPMPEDVNRVRDLWPGDMDETGRRAVQAWILSDSDVIDALIVASRKSQYWIERSEPNGCLADIACTELRGLRTLVYYLLLYAKLDACEGDTESAVEKVLAGYAMGTQLTGPRLMVDQLVGMALCNGSMKSAFQLLSKANLGATLMDSFQDRFHHLSTRWDHGYDFRADRLMALDWIQRTFSDNGNGGGCISRRRSLRLGWGWVRIDRADTVRLLEECFASFAIEARMTPWQCHVQGLSTGDAWERENNLALACDVISVSTGIRLSWRLRTQTTALSATLAILRYRADIGHLPDSLSELVTAGYLDTLPADPFGDGPLMYRQRDGDFVLYSRGFDFDDDGGVASGWGEDDEGGDKVFWPVSSSSGTNH